MRHDLVGLRATILIALTAGLGCTGGKGGEDTVGDASHPDADGGDADADGDGDTDTDADSDADADTDADTDTAHTGSTGAGPCAGYVQIMDANGVFSGLIECPDGSIDRLLVATCDTTINVASCAAGPGVYGNCAVDSDCTAGPNGKCVASLGYVPFCDCAYSCASDTDCGPGQACICGGALPNIPSWSHCVEATCATNADCATGECGVAVTTFGIGCPWEAEVDCRTTTDTCRADASCPAGEFCAFKDAPARWECKDPGNIACGRPLHVEGVARVAGPVRRDDWCADVPVRTDGAPAARLAAHWAQVAAMEHASVASFAKVALELMTLGAPPELLAGCAAAGADEVEHARLAWGLARAYGGTDHGPGPLPLAGLTLASDRRAVLENLVVEACVSETVAAAEVRFAAREATDPVLAATLDRIASDEERHAALGWRTLAWLLRGADDEDRRFAAAAFARAIDEVRGAAPGGLHEPEHGVVGGIAQVRLRRRVLDDVVAPAVRAAFTGAGRIGA